MSLINSIGTANPRFKIPQEQIAESMGNMLQMEKADKTRLGKLYNATGIRYRYSVLSDFLPKKPQAGYDLFPAKDTGNGVPSISERMHKYRELALPLTMDAIQSCFEQIPDFNAEKVTHLITVSCTGMYAPGLDIGIIENLGLKTTVERTAINYMGCYAALNGLKIADKICRVEPEANVLLVCVELCSIHFQKSVAPDHLLSHALFGDGAAAVMISNRQFEGKAAFRLESFYCDLLLNGKSDMAWNIENSGFEMTLSAYVPGLIKNGIHQLTQKFLVNNRLNLTEIDYFAIHPGGKGILRACEQALNISQNDNRFSYNVLEKYGNMSSPSVLFVLKEVHEQITMTDKNKRILSFAFGPGLAVEALLLSIQYA